MDDLVVHLHSLRPEVGADTGEVRAQSAGGEDIKILDARHALYQQQKRKNPARWSGHTRNCSPVGAVTLNPEREDAVKTEVQRKDKKAICCLT